MSFKPSVRDFLGYDKNDQMSPRHFDDYANNMHNSVYMKRDVKMNGSSKN